MSNVSVTVTFSTYEEAAAFLSRPAVPPQAAGKQAKVAAPAPALTEPAPGPVPGPAPAIPPADPAPNSIITYPQVGEKIAALVAKDRPKAVEILASFGVKKGPDMKPEHWPAAIALLNAALAA